MHTNNKFALYPRPLTESDPQINSLAPRCNRDFIDWRAAQLEVDTLRDLLYSQNQPSIIDNSEFEVNHLHPLVPFLHIPDPLPKISKHQLLIGRRYLTNHNKILEFVGHNLCTASPNNCLFREWISSGKQTLKTNMKVSLLHDSQTSISVTISELTNLVARIYCENKTNSRNHLTSSTIVAIVPDNPPCLRSRAVIQPSVQQSSGTVDLFTDASLLYSSKLSDCIFYKDKFHSSITGGAILFINKIVNKCVTIPIPTTCIVNPNSFEAEALTLYTSLIHFSTKILHANVFIDSESLFKQLQQRSIEYYLPDHPLINRLRQLRDLYKLNICWIRAHAEKRVRKKLQNFYEKGNMAADALTNHNQGKVHDLFPYYSSILQHKTVSIYPEEIQEDIITNLQLTVSESNSIPVSFKQQIKRWNLTSCMHYLSNRERISTRYIPWLSLTTEFSNTAIKSCGFSDIVKSKLVYDKYINKQYTVTDNVCQLCDSGTDNREHLLYCQHEELVRIRQLYEVSLSQLPINHKIWERSALSNELVQTLRQDLITLIKTDHRTRIGLFTKLQIRNICSKFTDLGVNVKHADAIREDLINLLKVTIYESYLLIKFRNQRVNNKSLTIPTTTEQIWKMKPHKRWFQEIAHMTLEPLLVTSVLVTHNFPPHIKIINLDVNISLEANVERTLNIKGKLYQTHTELAVISYTSFRGENTTATLWPHYAFSSPIKFNRVLKAYQIDLFDERMGEAIYFRRFKFLLGYIYKLLATDGLHNIYQLLNAISGNEPTISVNIKNQYAEFYLRIYKYISNVSDLVTFLNWHVTNSAALILEEVIKWIINSPNLHKNRIRRTLIKDCKDPILVGNTASFAISIKRTKKVESDHYSPCSFSSFSEKFPNSNFDILKEYTAEINVIISEYNSQRCKEHPELQNLKTLTELLKNKVRKTTNLISYHRHQLLDKIVEIIHRIQNYQSNQKTKEKKLLTNKQQPKITSFLKDPPH